MYKVTSGGEVIGYSDSVVFIRLYGNGCYVPCDVAEAEGVCVKLPYECTDENGNTIKSTEDIVFKYQGGKLLGIEREAELEETSGALLIEQAEEVISILLGGNIA
jgi:hypothetical protein